MIFAFGDFELDEARWELRKGGIVLNVPPKVLHTIVLLVANRHRIVSNEELYAGVWPGVTVTEASIRKSIRLARQVLSTNARDENFITTVRSRGYRFVAEVRELPSAPSSEPVRAIAPMSRPPPLREPFVGRDAELGELSSALDRTLLGRGTLLLVSGEAGMGKTSLVETFAERAIETGARVEWGRCCEEGGAPELRPWLQILESALVYPLFSAAPEWMQREVARILPSKVSGAVLPEEGAFPSETARFRLFDAITALLRRAAERGPIVLILEDLHSADAATLLLTRFFARETKDAAVLVIGTYRPSDAGTDASTQVLLGKLARHARTIALEGLPEDGTRELIGAMRGAPVAAGFAARVQRVSEGNPFFVSEIVRSLAAAPEASFSSAEMVRVPEHILEVVRARFEPFGERTRDVLAVAAVIGREFDLGVVCRVSALGQEEVTRALEPARERKIVVARPGASVFRFTHILFRDVLYEDLSIGRRAEIHRRVGDVLESCAEAGAEPSAAQLAHHFTRAALEGGSLRAALHSIEAGKKALSSLAFEEAVRHFERALEALRLAPDVEELRADLLLSLGHAERLTGNYRRAADTFTRGLTIAQNSGDALRAARAALGYAEVKPEPGMLANQELIAVLEGVVPRLEAAQAHDHDARELFALVLARLATCLSLARRREDAEVLSHRASELGRALGRPATLAHALLSRHWVLWKPGLAAARLAIAIELSALDPPPDAQARAEACVCRITDLLELGRIDGLKRALADHERLAEASREPLTVWRVRAYATMLSLLEGRFEEAERTAHAALSLGMRVNEENARILHGAHLAWTRVEQGRRDELEPQVRLILHGRPPNALVQCFLLRVRAEMGDAARAGRELLALARNDFAALEDDWTFLPALAHLAAACAFLRDGTHAPALYDRLVRYDGTHVVAGPGLLYLGPVSLQLGLLALALEQWSRAVSFLETARAESGALGARPAAVRAGFHLAEALGRRGSSEDRRRARRELDEALSVARALGMTSVTRRAEALRATLGSGFDY